MDEYPQMAPPIFNLIFLALFSKGANLCVLTTFQKQNRATLGKAHMEVKGGPMPYCKSLPTFTHLESTESTVGDPYLNHFSVALCELVQNLL